MTQAKQEAGFCTISPGESQSFARVSGDFNPLHLDPVMARRYQFGSTLIHGIHGTMRALDTFFAARPSSRLTSLQVTFSKPARQGEELRFNMKEVSATAFRIEVHSQARRVQSIVFAIAEDDETVSSPGRVASNPADQAEPRDINLQQAQELDGSTPLTWAPDEFHDLFPQLAKKLPDMQSATILATTKVVGMICPGLNSVYARLELNFEADSNAPVSDMHYRVQSADPRFSRVLMEVSNAAATGTIEAFFRPAPVIQASTADIRSLLPKDRFSGQRALIVGGSRGLGEVTAKLLCAGGATALISYSKGRDDALRVTTDIAGNGGNCKAVQIDVLDDKPYTQLFSDPDPITHIYYMASPLIEKSGSPLWDANLFSRYTDFYIAGLARLLEQFTNNNDYRNSSLTVYLPSTVFLDRPEKGYAEYTASKAAAESFVQHLVLKYPEWKFVSPRLPRMLTDQTSGVAGLDTLDSARKILASLENH